MVSNCANPGCAKPLHYLRDGRIFLFDVSTRQTGTGGKLLRRVEHYWLCGECSQTMLLVQQGDEIRIVPKPRVRNYAEPRAADWAS